MWQIEPGDACTISYRGMDVERDPFIKQPCTVIKITKAGLIKIVLDSDSRKTISIALYDYIPLITLESVQSGKPGKSPSYFKILNIVEKLDPSTWKIEPTRDLKVLHGLDVEDNITQMLIETLK
jgi:hypothetical protein